jgi:HSP20 family protein
MALMRWEPLGGIMSLRRDMDRLFEDFFDRSPFRAGQEGMNEPAIEVADAGDHIAVKMQVPGIEKEKLQLEIANDTLTIKGEMQEEDKQEEKHYYRREFRYGAFSRTIPLPTGVQEDQAKAQLKDGVLTVTVPKGEQNKTKRITIETTDASATSPESTPQTGRDPIMGRTERTASNAASTADKPEEDTQGTNLRPDQAAQSR